MINIKKLISKLWYLFLILNFGCEEESKQDSIIGTWVLSNLQEYENMNCTDSLLNSTTIFDYTENYIFNESNEQPKSGQFTWSRTIATTNTNTINGNYTVNDSIYYLNSDDVSHRDRVGKLITETTMEIKVQWDAINDDENLIDTCFKLTFEKIE